MLQLLLLLNLNTSKPLYMQSWLTLVTFFFSGHLSIIVLGISLGFVFKLIWHWSLSLSYTYFYFFFSMKRRRTLTTGVDMAIFKDIAFPRTCPGADYDTSWNDCFHDRNIFAISSCYESAVLFAAREGWVIADAPVCQRLVCIAKRTEICKRKSYIYKRNDICGWAWRYPCCKRKLSILIHSIFYRSKLGPGKLIEILWKLACRTPVSLISVLVLGRHTSEIYARIQFFRDVAG